MLYIILGVTAGILSGLLGIGGATIIIPCLVYFFGFSQHNAQGTTIALMVPPIGLLAAIKYYVNGNVNIKIGLLIALGFFIGGYFGANIAQPINDTLLRRFFAVFLILIGIKMFFGK